MNAEVDEIISMMRRSKMDDIRAYLEKLVKLRDKKEDQVTAMLLMELKAMFRTTSTPKQS